jgi:spore coat protein YutH
MFEKMLKEKYGIKDGYELDFERYRAFKQNASLYLIMNVNGKKEQEISEIKKISDQLRTFGDQDVPSFLSTKEDAAICEWEGGYYSLLQYRQPKPLNPKKTGKKLAKFHYRGRYMPFQVKTINRIGQWKQLWEKRLDQMEGFWNSRLNQSPENEFEKMFFDSFPYYMGLAENSIQYLTDTELDSNPLEMDNGTVCHERFKRGTWGQGHLVKNPYDWVFDHASRDLAEWIRERYFYNSQTYQPDVRNLLDEYQQISKLSGFSWRLLYSRLLFPLHYFECVENYYITNSEQEKLALEERLQRYLTYSAEQERFLAGFYQLVDAPVRSYKLPAIKWLMK